MKKLMIVLVAALAVVGAWAEAVPERVLELAVSKRNARNGEGDFAKLKDGSILYVYAEYVTKSNSDHAPAHLVSRVSKDGGMTWSEPVEAVANEGGMNVMTASLFRLKDGSLGLVYHRKNSLNDCRAMMRVSRDEGKTWVEPRLIIPDSETSYYCFNPGRVTRLKSGRLVLPLAKHANPGGKFEQYGELVCFCSDDEGKTWKRVNEPFKTYDEKGKRIITQEPGVIELKDGRVLMYARTFHGRQWYYYSSDECATWTKGEPSTLWSPASPATIERLENGDLIVAWNDHEGRKALRDMSRRGMGIRVPLTLAISKDEGKTWINRRNLEGYHRGLYCYPAFHFEKDYFLLQYFGNGLSNSRITKVPLSWMYENVPEYKLPEIGTSVFAAFKHKTPVEKLETALGTWTAAPGNAAIQRGGYHNALKILGDKVAKKEFEVMLTLPKAAPSDALKLAIYPYYATTLVVDAQQEDGTWQTVYEVKKGGKKTPALTWMDFKKLEKPVTAYRFRGKSSRGISLIDVDEFAGINAFFNSL